MAKKSRNRRIRILVADDHPVVREGLVAMLSTQSDFEVVAETGDGGEVVPLVRELEPHVVLLDLEMPGVEGTEIMNRLREAGLDTRVLVFTAFDTDEKIVGALRAGARGYLLKGVPRQDLFDAVRVVNRGESLLQPVVASKLVETMSRREPDEALTPRELEVLGFLGRGLQNKEIAGELHISERTVKFHLSSILGKLGAGNRTEALTIAARKGLIEL